MGTLRLRDYKYVRYVTYLLQGYRNHSHNQVNENACMNDFHQSIPIEDDDKEFIEHEGIGGREQRDT